MTATPRRSVGAQIYRWLLRALPSEFRGDFGDAMLADSSRHASWWTREIPGLIAAVIREHADGIRRDLRDSIRQLAHTPGVTIAAVLMLAVGTGANVAVYSVVDAVLVRPSIPDPGRAVVIFKPRTRLPSTRRLSLEISRSVAMMPEIEAASTVYSLITSTGHTADPRQISVECVSPSIAAITGAHPVMGRMFSVDEDRAGARVALISDAMWRKDFNSRADVLGVDVVTGTERSTIIGVMPKGYTGALGLDGTEVWMPIGPAFRGQRTACGDVTGGWLVARLRKPVTMATAAPAMAAAGLEMHRLEPLAREGYQQPIVAMMITAICVLMIACANVANLQLERGQRRQREMSVRLALGASRWSLARQALVENLLLSLAGAACGAAAASPLVTSLAHLMPKTIPHTGDIGVDSRVLLVTTSAAIFCGMLVGLVPALKTMQGVDLRSARSVTGRRSVLSRALVTLALALSIMLVVGAGLMARTLHSLNPSDLGFEPAGRVTAQLSLLGDEAARVAANSYGPMIDRLRATPQISDAAVTTYLPLRGYPSSVKVVTTTGTMDAWSGELGSRFASAVGAEMIAGREFTDTDTAGSQPVALVNETFVEQFFGGSAQSAVGQVLNVRSEDGQTTPRLIAGVMRDMRTGGYDTAKRIELFIPITQGQSPNFVYFVMKTDLSAANVRRDVSEIVRAFIARPIIEPVEALATTTSKAFSRARFAVWLFGVFAAIAALLAAGGLAAIVSWSVAERRREIAIRLALGSTSSSTVHLILRQALLMTSGGVLVGIAGSVAGTRLLSDWLYQVKPTDPLTFIGGTAAMFLIAALAAYLPARRAARIDPAIALRTE